MITGYKTNAKIEPAMNTGYKKSPWPDSRLTLLQINKGTDLFRLPVPQNNKRTTLFRLPVLQNNRGIALLVVLALISVLMAAALELARGSGDSADMDKRTADRFQAEEMAKSAIGLAMFILVRDAEQNDIDSVQEMWADPGILEAAIQLLGFRQGAVDLVITDELGKIQVNALLEQFPGDAINNDQSALWERFLNMIISSDKSVDLRDPAEIINSLKDWLDSGDDDAISGLSGAEADYYQALDPPVICSNAPFDRVDGIFMVKGIPENLTYLPAHLVDSSNSIFSKSSGNGSSPYSGYDSGFPESSFFAPDIDNSSGSNVSSVSSNNLEGSYQYLDPGRIFTVYGIESSKKEGTRFSYPGTININTADVAVLAAMLPEGMEDQASELADFRTEREVNGKVFSNNLDSGWYKKVIALSPKDAKNFDRIARYSSNFFKVAATAQFNDARISLTGFVKREKLTESGKWGCKLLQITED
ncbi:MAG: general secretion pathway protein GspK [Desulfamplus sp.]|nr:general secretion pathway protein GspK [Desulfamplus sp.]